ncbi:hypothetical protein SB749_20980, partial [Brevibacterium sp. SIMBA_078]
VVELHISLFNFSCENFKLFNIPEQFIQAGKSVPASPPFNLTVAIEISEKLTVGFYFDILFTARTSA